MPIRNLQVLGEGATGSRSFGISLDKSELREDGLIDDDDELADVPLAISREGRGEWSIRALDAD